MTTYPEINFEYSKIINTGDKFLLTLVSGDVSLFFGNSPSGPGHILTQRMTNGLRFDTGSPFDIYIKSVGSDSAMIALTIW